MTILDIMKMVCNETGLPEPTTVVGSTDTQVKQLLQQAYRVGHDLRHEPFNFMQRKASIVLVNGQDSYAFPVDYNRQMFETHWNSGLSWPLIGPYSAQEWEAVKNGLVSPAITQRFCMKGYGSNQLYIDPVPNTTTAGKTLTFVYYTDNWVKPITWASGLVFTAGSYCFSDGVYYKTTLGGTASGTSPINDVGVTWAVFSGVYDTFMADTDEPHFDDFLFAAGVRWQYLRSKGLPYGELQQQYNNDVKVHVAKSKGGRTLSLIPRRRDPRLMLNVPQTGFGGI